MTSPNLPAIATPSPEIPSDFTVVARDPAGMIAAQRSLIEWCDRKIAVEAELKREAEQEAATVEAAGFSPKAWRRRVYISGRRIAFYEKIKAALAAGYYIVPPFPMELFAVRTNRSEPLRKASSYQFSNREQAPTVLPHGEGRYVSPVPLVEGDTWKEPDPRNPGQQVTKEHYWASRFTAVEFPFKLARGAVMTQVAEAMALKLFDQLGVLPRVNAPDPLVCGQIINPSRPHDPPVTFFVAWWLDTSTL
jgi:hypothetical protein